jgi:hypothetical protein
LDPKIGLALETENAAANLKPLAATPLGRRPQGGQSVRSEYL